MARAGPAPGFQGAVTVLDIATVLYYAAMGLALVGADAYWYADSIISKVEVSRKYADQGLSADFATTLFSHELQTIFSNESIIRTPDIRAANDQSVISVIASSLKLDDLTYAFQHMFGLDPVQVKVALMDNGTTQAILVTSTSRTRAPFTILLDREPDEEMPRFVRRAAVETSARLDPYHTSLYLLERNDTGKNMPQLKTLLQTNLDRLPPTPDNAERALFRNLQGITALLDKDLTKAGELFELAAKDTNNYSAALLNLGFVRVEQDRYEEALQAVQPIIERRARPRNPAIHAAAYTLRGVANWALKRHAIAERDFAEAARLHTTGSDMFIYWSLMLEELGRTAEAQQKRLIGEQNLDVFEQYPEVATLYFWLDEVDGRQLTRRTEPHPSQRTARIPVQSGAPTPAPAPASAPVSQHSGGLLKN
jgi:hypothetical protein